MLSMFRTVVAAALAVLISFSAAGASAQDRPTRESYMFSYADRDGDGVLSPGEFAIVLYPSATVANTPKALYGADMDKFDAADADHSGGIDRDEFSAWFRQRR